jgi:thioredoxin-dependent peroxiredoxin
MPAKQNEAAASHPLVGKPAPKFKLPSSTGETVDSSTLKSGTYVLYFYPKADTPGCTKEACGFSDAVAHYKKLDVPVFGVSPDPIRAVQKFAQKFDLKFPLLADEDHAVCDAYGVWQEKSMYGRKYWGAARSTFVIRDGKVSHVFAKVKPEGHDQEVLTFLKNM